MEAVLILSEHGPSIYAPSCPGSMQDAGRLKENGCVYNGVPVLVSECPHCGETVQVEVY